MIYKIITLATVFGLNGYAFASNDCIDVNYIKFTSLYYVAVGKQQLLNEADKNLKVEDSYLAGLYDKYSQLAERVGNEGSDFRLAFKPCDQEDWAFVSLDEKISISGRSFRLSDDEFNRIVSKADAWK